MTVSMVHVHHEGGGSPTTAAGCERFRGPYCYGIGTDTFVRWLAPEDNYATADWNGRDWTPCFPGNRMDYPLTDHDLEVLHAAFMDAYGRGEVTAEPQVVAHRDAGGSNATACPGDLVMARWDEVVAACRASSTPKPPEPEPEDEKVTDLASAINHDGRPVIFQVGGDRLLYTRTRDAKGGDWSDWKHLDDGKKGFETVTAFVAADKRIEIWVTLKDGHSFSRRQTADFASWENWIDQTR